MIIAAGSDHAGYNLKNQLVQELEKMGWQVLDHGVNSGETSSDYPNIAKKVSNSIIEGTANRGLLVCGSGIGMAMAANRFRGIRAFVGCSETHAKLARLHNDANVLTLGERTTGALVALEILKVFLDTAFEGGRHEKRVALLG